MLAVRQHLIFNLVDQVFVRSRLVVPLLLLQTTDSYFAIDTLQESDICFRQESPRPLFVPNYIGLKHLGSPSRQHRSSSS